MTYNAVTDPDSGRRTYPWQGRQLTSVTSLRKDIGMPHDLHNWIVAESIDAALLLANRGVLTGTFDEAEFLELKRLAGTKEKGYSTAKKKLADVRRPIRELADTTRDAAADLGKRVHSAADARQAIEAADEEVAPFLRQFYTAERVLRMETVLSEAQVFNLTHGYAGTLDLLAWITDPETGERYLALIDIKTGKDTYIDHLIQTLLYAFGEFVGRDDVIDHAATHALHQAQAVGILHLRPDHWEWQELAAPDTVKEAIFHQVALANFYAANPRIDPYIAKRIKGEA